MLVEKHIHHTLQQSQKFQMESTVIEIQRNSGPILIVAYS